MTSEDESMGDANCRPFLKWAGGKFRVLKQILPRLPRGQRLIEPFAGSAAVFLNARYEENLVNDINADLISVYRAIQRDAAGFIDRAGAYFQPENNDKDVFYGIRQEFNESDDPERRAVLFIYLNRHCFNGLTRYNSKGGFNVPFGRYRAPKLPRRALEIFSAKAAQATFTTDDFRTAFLNARAGDVIYADPPYVPLTDTAFFTNYSGNGFDLKDQEDLADLARRTTARGIPVLISNHDTKLTRKLYQGADITTFGVHRHISCKADGRKAAQELLALFSP